ncbi:hypothetical protein GCM10009718_16100 [Isoptericola halotolerans]|uniref:Uncharacterized protein n=1 Tax=Isoptericola halotolerans TaxID=300560 RepID=A0ABX1ZXY2_9MICO|nr:hypothetical protein [Isoptericola halotolerans]NOV95472.1 hypothetical protein [Isoptericola halotolerans]
MGNTPRAVTAESFILVPHTVTDLEDFSAHHERYLVSIDAEPERAVSLWHERLRDNPYGSEGFLDLRYHGQELMAPELWDEVYGIWHSLVEIIDDFLATGTGSDLFPDQPVGIELKSHGRSAVFRVHEKSVTVDPEEFIPGVLHEAKRYFSWVALRIGSDETPVLERIESVGARFRREQHRST